MNALLFMCTTFLPAADPVEQYIGANTVLVARVDLTKLTPTAITDTLKNVDPAGLDATQLAAITQTHAAFTAAGVRSLYLVWNYDANSIWPIAIAPVDQAAQANAIVLLLRGLAANSTIAVEASGSLVLASTPGALANFKHFKAAPRPDLALADGPAVQGVLKLSDDMRKVLEELTPPLPQRFGPIGPVIRGLAGAKLTLELAPKLHVTAQLQGKDAIAAGALGKILGEMRTEALSSKAPPEANLIARTITPVVRGDQVVVDLDMEALKGPLGEGIKKSREAALRSQSMNNLRQIALAMHSYHDAHKGVFPGEIVDKAGKPLLSWRVQLLPYLDQDTLYSKFKLDEPWDSPNNRVLLEAMPDAFRNQSRKDRPGLTAYFGPAGNGMLFETAHSGKGLGLRNIKDGTSWTIMIVEANGGDAMPWTKPEPFVPGEDSLKQLVGNSNGFNAAFCDGSARFISKSIKPTSLKAAFTINGNEDIEWP